jgi:hypothetical protein
MGIKGYKVYDRRGNLVDTLKGTHPRKYLDILRKKNYKVRKIK